MRRRILAINPNLNQGGGEKVLATLLAHFDPSRFEVSLALLLRAGTYLNMVPEHVAVHDLRVKRVLWSLCAIVGKVREQQPQIVFSNLSHLNLAVLFCKPFFPAGTRVVVRETGVPSQLLADDPRGSLMRPLYRLLYRRADRIICQSDFGRADLIREFGIDGGRITVINNPLPVDAIIAASKENSSFVIPERPYIVAAGRLEPVKRYDLLIETVARMKNKNIALVILGQGSREEELRLLAKERGISERVLFPGFLSALYPVMAHARLGILSSKYEAFPNTVLEMNACGVPVVAVRCPGGIAEIIEEEKNGWLVEEATPDTLAHAIDTHIEHSLTKETVAGSVRRRYDVSVIVPQYERLFEEVVRG